MQPMAFFILPNVGKADFRWFLVFPMLGKPIFDDFLFSQCWESRFLLISCFPNVGKVDFRRFLVFPMLGKPFFADFWFSPMRESRFSMISCFPPWGKADFRWFLVFPREGKPILIVFWFSLTGDKLVFADFYLSYPYESFFLPIFVHRTPYLDNFSRKSTIYSRIWTIFLENRRFTIVSGQFFLKIDDLLSYLDWFSRKLMNYFRIWAVFSWKGYIGRLTKPPGTPLLPGLSIGRPGMPLGAAFPPNRFRR